MSEYEEPCAKCSDCGGNLWRRTEWGCPNCNPLPPRAAALNAEPAGLTADQLKRVEEMIDRVRGESAHCGDLVRSTIGSTQEAYRQREQSLREDAEALESLLLARSAPASETEERNTPDTN